MREEVEGTGGLRGLYASALLDLVERLRDENERLKGRMGEAEGLVGAVCDDGKYAWRRTRKARRILREALDAESA